MYKSDWIENTGTMPSDITADTMLDVMYTDGVVMSGTDYDDACLWWREGDDSDIDMYRYHYKEVKDQDYIDEKGDHEYQLLKDDGFFDKA